MKQYRAEIFFQDEAPKLGSGRRRVTVKEGRKFVYISDHLGRKVKFTKRAFEELHAKVLSEAIDYPSEVTTLQEEGSCQC